MCCSPSLTLHRLHSSKVLKLTQLPSASGLHLNRFLCLHYAPIFHPVQPLLTLKLVRALLEFALIASLTFGSWHLPHFVIQYTVGLCSSLLSPPSV